MFAQSNYQRERSASLDIYGTNSACAFLRNFLSFRRQSLNVISDCGRSQLFINAFLMAHMFERVSMLTRKPPSGRCYLEKFNAAENHSNLFLILNFFQHGNVSPSVSISAQVCVPFLEQLTFRRKKIHFYLTARHLLQQNQ